MVEIFIILGLIILNGIFSMAEIALVSARKARLEAQANKGDTKAKRALQLAAHPDNFLSTVQIGITLIGILTGIFSGEALEDELVQWLQQYPSLIPYSKTLGTGIIVIILTYFSLVLGELVPKRIGLSKPEVIAKRIAGPMQLIMRITYPFIWLLSKSTSVLSRLLGIKANDAQVTEEEIKAIINEGTEQGAIEEAEQEIIERVFHLGDRNITSLMTHRVDISWVNITSTVQQVKEEIKGELHTVYPVCEDEIDAIKGVVSIKDLLVAPNHLTMQELMKPAPFVPENNSAYQLLERFKQSKIHYCFIVDEYGTLEGMITLNDILEAIVGDMPQMETDDYSMVQREDGTYLVDAQLPFYDLLSKFDKIEWLGEAEQEFDTLAGFILHHMQRIPATGDKFAWRGMQFEIIDMDGHRIDKILLTLPEEML
jgi:putative hemolysin